MRDFLTPSALAEKCGLSKRTVLYYNEIGILNPKIINEKGERYYTKQQIEALNLLKTLREVGISLKTIKAVVIESNYSYSRVFKHFQKDIHSQLAHLTQVYDQISDHYTNPRAILKKFEVKTSAPKKVYTTDIHCSIDDIPKLLDNLVNYFIGPTTNLTILLQFDTDILIKSTVKLSLGIVQDSNIKPKAKYKHLFSLIETPLNKVYTMTTFQTKTNEIQAMLKLAKTATLINKNRLMIELHGREKDHQKHISIQSLLL